MHRIPFPLSHRYLVRFGPKHIPHVFTDVLVIGGGVAGARAALTVDPNLTTLLVTKGPITRSNSMQAQGGIAAVLDPVDDVDRHAADTIATGKGLCEEEIVRMVVREGPDRVRELVEMGTQFDTQGGEIALTREGGHSHPRVAHALGDATGKEIMRALIEHVRTKPSVEIWEHTFAIDLLAQEGQCRGALVWCPKYGKTLIWAKQTILATGGAGRLYRETTNPEIATADGHALAFRAGAEVRDMEFMQFHPTVLYIAGSSRSLISETVRGEGAYLRDCNGNRFMSDYDKAEELAPRDVVSRAIASQMSKTNHPCVYLDLSHLPAERVKERFPNIGKVCVEFGLDITTDRIPVRPGAHYMIGGVTVDDRGQTTLPGLWAAGEVTSTGLHGANRLGSNSLLEGAVYGMRAGAGASELALSQPDEFRSANIVSDWPRSESDEDELFNLADMKNSLSSLMWRNIGIERNAERLAEAGRQVDFWNRYVSAREFTEPTGWELQNQLLVARLIIAAASARTESRGVHYRSDYPDTVPEQAHHIPIVAVSE